MSKDNIKEAMEPLWQETLSSLENTLNLYAKKASEIEQAKEYKDKIAYILDMLSFLNAFIVHRYIKNEYHSSKIDLLNLLHKLSTKRINNIKIIKKTLN